MNTTDHDSPEKPKGEVVWDNILKAALALPGSKVNRSSFLNSQLSNHCDEEQVHRAIQLRPVSAGVLPYVIDKRADASIHSHMLKASGLSFAIGLPGGWAMAGSIPADVAQFYWHALVLAQKLAYLYGWPDILEGGEVDEETEFHLTLLVGAMIGTATAQAGLTELADSSGKQAALRMPRQALTRTAYIHIVKNVAARIGINATKRWFAGGVAQTIPVVGGVASAGVTAVLMQPMAKRLKKHLMTLRYAQPDEGMEIALTSAQNETAVGRAGLVFGAPPSLTRADYPRSGTGQAPV